MNDSLSPRTPTDFHRLPEKSELGKRLVAVSWILTVIVWLLVGVMQRVSLPLPEGVDLSFLPAVNAALNTTVAILLILALVVVVKGKRADLHARLIGAAVVLSVLFLVSYVTYHMTAGETQYGGEGVLRSVYFFLLISHIVLAGISFPFILLSLAYSLSNQFAKHKRMVKIAYPMWLYVAITGPIVFLMLRPYYG